MSIMHLQKILTLHSINDDRGRRLKQPQHGNSLFCLSVSARPAWELALLPLCLSARGMGTHSFASWHGKLLFCLSVSSRALFLSLGELDLTHVFLSFFNKRSRSFAFSVSLRFFLSLRFGLVLCMEFDPRC